MLIVDAELAETPLEVLAAGVEAAFHVVEVGYVRRQSQLQIGLLAVLIEDHVQVCLLDLAESGQLQLDLIQQELSHVLRPVLIDAFDFVFCLDSLVKICGYKNGECVGIFGYRGLTFVVIIL